MWELPNHQSPSPKCGLPTLSPVVNEFIESYQAESLSTDRQRTWSSLYGEPFKNVKKSLKQQVPKHYFFIGFKTAYGTVDHIKLWEIMDENSFQDYEGKCAKLCGDLSRTFQFAWIPPGYDFQQTQTIRLFRGWYGYCRSIVWIGDWPAHAWNTRKQKSHKWWRLQRQSIN